MSTTVKITYTENGFINKHDTKVQLTYRKGENLDGVDYKDEDEVFLQTQFVFDFTPTQN